MSVVLSLCENVNENVNVNVSKSERVAMLAMPWSSEEEGRRKKEEGGRSGGRREVRVRRGVSGRIG